MPQPFNLSRPWQDVAPPPEPKPAPAFKARPVPKTLNMPHVPAKPESAPKTTLKPFNLRSATLHAEHVEWKEKLLAAKERKEQQARYFKARPVSAGVFVPFSPTNVISPLSHPDKNLVLASDMRAEMRAKFDEALKEKIELQARLEQEQLRTQTEREHEAVKELRSSQQFKARGLPDFSRPWTPRARESPDDSNRTEEFQARKLEIMKAAKEWGKELEFKARRMPDFSQVWDPRSEKRQTSPHMQRRSTVSVTDAWGRMSNRDVVDPISPVKAFTLGTNYLTELLSSARGHSTTFKGSSMSASEAGGFGFSPARVRPSSAPTYVQQKLAKKTKPSPIPRTFK